MKSILFYFSLICGVALLMGSCQSRRTIATNYADLSGEWEIIEMNGKKLVPQETNQLLVLDTNQGTISGNAGCNRISGRIEYNPAQKNVVRFMQLVSTRMACLDMSLEDEFMKTIDKVVRFEGVGETQPVRTVALYGTDNSRLFVIRKK